MTDAEKYFLNVAVKDKEKKVIENSTIKVKEPNKPDKGKPFQKVLEMELTELGEYIMTVSAPKYSTLVQKFLFKEDKEKKNMTFVPAEEFCPASVELTRQEGQGPGSASSRINFVVTVTLYEPSEVVMVVGMDYHNPTGKGINFEAFCDSRVLDLENKKIIDGGTIVTVFNFKVGDGKMKTKMKSNSGKWEIRKEKQQWTAPNGENYKKIEDDYSYIANEDTMSITHVYDYIKEVGRTRPGTIKEFSIFSHSWSGGPILLNTEERVMSVVEGYAVRAKDTKGAKQSHAKILEITDEKLGKNQAKHVTCDEPIPVEANAVVQRLVSAMEIEGIEVWNPLRQGTNVSAPSKKNVSEGKSDVEGYALRAKDLIGASPAKPKILEIIEGVNVVVGKDQAKRVEREEPIPKGANAVVPKGDTLSIEAIKVWTPVKQGKNVRPLSDDEPRDPLDKDCRLKDFNHVNMPDTDLEYFKRAFHNDATIRFWGCLYAKKYRDQILQRIQAKENSETFGLTEEGSDGKKTTRMESKANFDKDLKKTLKEKSYMGIVAQKTGVKTYGTLIGMGANYGSKKAEIDGRQHTLQFMYINQKKHKKIFDYYRELGVEVDREYGYGFYNPNPNWLIPTPTG